MGEEDCAGEEDGENREEENAGTNETEQSGGSCPPF